MPFNLYPSGNFRAVLMSSSEVFSLVTVSNNSFVESRFVCLKGGILTASILYSISPTSRDWPIGRVTFRFRTQSLNEVAHRPNLTLARERRRAAGYLGICMNFIVSPFYEKQKAAGHAVVGCARHIAKIQGSGQGVNNGEGHLCR